MKVGRTIAAGTLAILCFTGCGDDDQPLGTDTSVIDGATVHVAETAPCDDEAACEPSFHADGELFVERCLPGDVVAVWPNVPLVRSVPGPPEQRPPRRDAIARNYRELVYRSLVMFPKSADPAKVDALVQRIAASFKASAGCEAITRSDGALMGPGAQAGEAGWILEADFRTLEDAMAALDADGFQEVAVRVEAVTSSIFLFEVSDV